MKWLACLKVRGGTLVLVLCCGSVFLQVGALGAARAAESAPFELVRSLQALEDQIAQGNVAAQATQSKMIAHISKNFLAADPQVWHERKNIRAAILYLFSGGQPDVLKNITEFEGVDKTDENLVKGAMAYAEGRDAEARGFLMDINPLALPSNLGGHLALVQATLLTSTDPVKALKLLDIARLLVPGTLVEEAALRREIFMIGDKGDLDKFSLLARQYMRRFGKAVYADNFRQRFTAMVAEIGLSNDVAHVQHLEKILGDLAPEEQTKLYLSVAQTAIIQGRIEIARYAAEKANKLASIRNDVARSNLYLGASLILTDDYNKGMAQLISIDATQLSNNDNELRNSALNTAYAIRNLTKDNDKPDLSEDNSSDAANVHETKSWPVMNEAQKAIANADALLSRPSP